MFETTTQSACNDLLNSNLVVDGVLGELSNSAINNLEAKIQSIFKSKKYIYQPDYNLIGVRMSDTYTNQFTDYGILITPDLLFAFNMSTKPGTTLLGSPPTVEGITGFSCLKEGQYNNVWKYQYNSNFRTLWSGLPYCVQLGNAVTVYRDIPVTGGLINRQAPQQTGYFGINFHSWAGFVYKILGNLSEGCNVTTPTVIGYLEQFFPKMPPLITYTLLHKNDFVLMAA